MQTVMNVDIVAHYLSAPMSITEVEIQIFDTNVGKIATKKINSQDNFLFQEGLRYFMSLNLGQRGK